MKPPEKGFGVKAFQVNILGLSNKVHHFTYRLDDAFFKEYGSETIAHGDFQAEVTLDKRETFIEAIFKMKGTAALICDRSLKPFDEPIAVEKPIVFKYGEEEGEISDEIIVIHRDKDVIDIGQYLYEYLVLAVPMKKLHPEFRNEETDDDSIIGKMVYTTPGENSADEVDPRWAKLKKLK